MRAVDISSVATCCYYVGDSVADYSHMMESQATSRHQMISSNEVQNLQPPCSRPRDPPPLIRRDFVTSPWKRFRPSSDDADQPPRRRPASGNNIRDCPVADATGFPASMQHREPRHSRARYPGFTDNAATASCSRRHLSSSVDFQGVPAGHTSERFRHLEQQVDGPARCPRFTANATNSRFDLASSTGNCMSFHRHYVSFFICYSQIR